MTLLEAQKFIKKNYMVPGIKESAAYRTALDIIAKALYSGEYKICSSYGIVNLLEKKGA